MLGYWLTVAELGIALGNQVLHARDIFKDFRGQLRGGGTTRKDALRRLAAGRKISQPKNSATLPTLAASISGGSGFSRHQATLAILYGASVSQVQVVQYFG
jgi:hypothetical protein